MEQEKELTLFSQVNRAKNKGTELDFNLNRLELSEIPLSHLRQLADFGGFAKSSVWHRRFARLIRDAGYINAALKEFGDSLRLNPREPLTMGGIAKCYEVRKDYRRAIEWERKALSTWAKEENEDKALSLEAIATWQEKMGDREKAIQELQEALKLQPQHPTILRNYIDLLNVESRLEDIISLATDLQRDLSNLNIEDTLCTLLKDPRAQQALSRAAGATGKTHLIERSLEKTLALAEIDDTEQVSENSYYLTRFRCRYVCDESQIIQLWEDLLEKVQPRTTDNSFFYVLKRTVNALGQLYYDRATTAELDGEDPNVWISKLMNIIKPSKAGNITESNARQTNVLHLGVWHRLHGRNEEARACFKVRILEAIDILTDDYPENDTYGFEVLAQVLHKAGDDDGTAVAISVPMALLNKIKIAAQSAREHVSRDESVREAGEDDDIHRSGQRENTQRITKNSRDGPSEIVAYMESESGRAPADSTEEQEPIDDFDSLDLEAQEKRSADDTDRFTWRCDGECTRGAEEWQAIYACDVCLELCFCDRCVELVKNNRLGFRLCSPNHTFWQCYPSDERLLEVATEKVEGKMLPRAAWLEKLREEWAVS